ncbi:MAG: leucine-rich repeat domain-containing protein [Opitutaceae bacterium]|nr:leucine-rich repeat domain-containing protein [Opitutaceae bacterium]
MEELSLAKNRIRTLDPLRGCTSLRELNCKANPITDFSALAVLPELRTLEISADQVPAFCGCGALLQLRKLKIVAPGAVSSLRDLPPMPKLIGLDVDGLESLEGLDRCPELLNLNVRGTFGSLVPGASLARLTVGYFSTDRDLDLSPLSALYALRKLGFWRTGLTKLEALSRLPVLHEVGAWSGAEKAEGLALLRSSLSPWDDEFGAKAARTLPAAELRVVSRSEFDRFDSSEPYGLRADECDEAMVLAEQEWLQNRLRSSLSIDLTDEEDFCLPIDRIGFRRSHTLMIYSLKAFTSFGEIVRRVQTVLGEAKNDWIIYCQSSLFEGPDEQPAWAKDFVVWIYPSEIWVTAEHEATVRRLLSFSDD